MKATFELEAVELAIHGGPIAGVDEAGRGPLAGPVVAAAVILDPDRIPDGIADSKLLEADVRRALYKDILATARVGVGIAGPVERGRASLTNGTWGIGTEEIASACGTRRAIPPGRSIAPIASPWPARRRRPNSTWRSG